MNDPLKLLAILAHPDNESLGMGSAIAKYSAEGARIDLICATRGERGWMGDEKDDPGMEALGKIRAGELLCAANALGIRQVYFLDYIDGDLDQADANEAMSRIAGIIRETRPHVAVTFGPDGAYGHPDHIAISQFASGGVFPRKSCIEDGARSNLYLYGSESSDNYRCVSEFCAKNYSRSDPFSRSTSAPVRERPSCT